MVGNIKKIEKIKNMAVYIDYEWAKSVRDKGNNVSEFKEINIIYGRNYSGKTTLSRIIRSLETKELSDKYNSPEFVINFDGYPNINNTNFKNSTHLIRVFNEDFIRENLKFIVDDQQPINSFAVLGEDNGRIEEEIEACNAKLGSDEEVTGYLGQRLRANNDYNQALNSYTERINTLEGKLKGKANSADNGIKHNKIYGDVNYNVNKLKTDIDRLSKLDNLPLSIEQEIILTNTIKDDEKKHIDDYKKLNLKLEDLYEVSKKLIGTRISISNPIQELLNNAALDAWVRAGRQHHKDLRDSCGFCGSRLPDDLWVRLDGHFNAQSEGLLERLNSTLSEVENEFNRSNSLLNVDLNDYYSQYHIELNNLMNNYSSVIGTYKLQLEEIKLRLNAKIDNLYDYHEFSDFELICNEIDVVFKELHLIKEKSNKVTSTLKSDKIKAINTLRLNEVCKFINDISYHDELIKINKLNNELSLCTNKLAAATQDVERVNAEITDLKLQLNDESKGAEQVNEYLCSFFGHDSLKLEAIKDDQENGVSGYRFEVMRNNKKAYHLSEGECSLIAFCYFMAKLRDINTKGMEPIIWIDDPISSLDSNHIFFIYSIINSEIVTPDTVVVNGVDVKRDKYKQIFISTHNLDFLKYLKKLSGEDGKKSEYFIVTRNNETSNLELMPKYLRNYVTEYNYLFHQIYKCSTSDVNNDDNHHLFYNFGNNTRKFLEAFLFYKYPNAKHRDNDKLDLFFDGNKQATSLVNRVNNEYSHLEGVFERSMMPIDVPEMQKVGKFILLKIKEKDAVQYMSLLESIGVKQCPFE